MRKLLFLSLLGFICGIGLFIYVEGLSLILLLGLFFLSLFLMKKHISYFLIALILGNLIAGVNFNSYDLDKFENIDLSLLIIDKEENKDSFTYTAKAKNSIYRINEKSIITTDKKFEIGDKIIGDFDIDLVSKNTNPYLFNYRNYMLGKRVKTILKINNIDKIYKTDYIGLKLKRNFRAYIDNIFDRNLSEESSKFVKSVVLAQKYENISDLSSLGISHLLAVSGLHIDLILGLIVFILIQCGISYSYSMPIGILFSIFYGYLIGFPFSIVRVILLYSINYLGFLLKKGRDIEKILIISLLLILIINPFAIFHASLILSFLAGFAIYVIYPKFRKKDSYIENNFLFIGVLQLVMFPFLIYYFQSFNLMSIMANFLIVPIFQISAYLIFIIILSYPIFGGLLFIVFKLLDFLIKSIINMATFLNSIDIFRISFPKESIFISIYFLVLLYIILELRNKKIKNIKKYLILSILIVVFSISKDLNKPISFSMVDIGQGDCFILEDGRDVYLFDCGEISFNNYNSTDRILIPILKAKGVKEIKGVFISHEDKDHYGALKKLRESFDVKKVYVNKYNVDTFKDYDLEILYDNDKLVKKNIIINVLENYDGEENEDSMPLLIEIRGTKILTMGDLPSFREEIVARDADILKVSHHGSKSSTSKEFLKKVNPKIALISAGRNNIYKHPSKEVLKKLKGIKTYNTQTDGYVEIKFYDNKFKVESYVKGGFFRWIIKNLWLIYLIIKQKEYI